jgi:hypothetical protein
MFGEVRSFEADKAVCGTRECLNFLPNAPADVYLGKSGETSYCQDTIHTINDSQIARIAKSTRSVTDYS